jgi:nicotinamidase-related amidase
MLSSNAALLVIDVQRSFDMADWGEGYHPETDSNISRLLSAWRETESPVIVVQHLSTSPESTLHPDSPGSALKPQVVPQEGEMLVQKRVNSAFIGSDLEAHLREEEIEELVLVGYTTNHCVSSTARMAENLGFETMVVEDATTAYAADGPGGRRYSAEDVHAISLANLHGEFATVMSADNVLAARKAAETE